MIEYMQSGGPFMWLILFCSVVTFAVFAERILYFHRATIQVGEFLRGLSNLFKQHHYAEALHESAGTPGPVARVVHTAIVHHKVSRQELKEIVQEAGQLEVPLLEAHLALLATLALVTPLIGLLGTVDGMIEAFSALSRHSDFTSSAEISRGIYQSLLTTAAGLAVAIPAFLGYSYLSSRVNRLMHDIERGGIEIVNLITEKNRNAEPHDSSAHRRSLTAE